MKRQTWRMSVGSVAVLALMMLVNASSTRAVTVTTTATADVRLVSLAPTTVFNDSYNSPYNDPGTSNYQRALVQFDLSTIPGGATINSATLAIAKEDSVTSENPSGSRIEIYRVTKAWVETQATWNRYSTGNAWATAGGDYTGPVGGYAYSTQNPGAGGAFTWDVTSLVADWVTHSLPNDGLLVYGAGPNKILMKSISFAAGTGTDPRLVVDFTVPEPATMAALAIGGVGMLLRRRRHG